MSRSERSTAHGPTVRLNVGGRGFNGLMTTSPLVATTDLSEEQIGTFKAGEGNDNFFH